MDLRRNSDHSAMEGIKWKLVLNTEAGLKSQRSFHAMSGLDPPEGSWRSQKGKTASAAVEEVVLRGQPNAGPVRGRLNGLSERRCHLVRAGTARRAQRRSGHSLVPC